MNYGRFIHRHQGAGATYGRKQSVRIPHKAEVFEIDTTRKGFHFPNNLKRINVPPFFTKSLYSREETFINGG